MTLPENAFCQTLQLDHKVANLAHYEQLIVKEIGFQFFVHTPISSVNSLIYRIEDVAKKLDPTLDRQ